MFEIDHFLDFKWEEDGVNFLNFFAFELSQCNGIDFFDIEEFSGL